MTLPNPISRSTGLVTKEVARELLVYDLEWHRAHSLNTVAAAVWRRCDGGGMQRRSRPGSGRSRACR
jgi:hypothetical protein